jgi:DNA-binding transcriptional LysR family regulator
MDKFQNMKVFVSVVGSGSFTAAAQHLKTTTAYVSRAVSDLESHLRTRLLHRTTRRIALTGAGERYAKRCEEILAYVDQAEGEASDAHVHPSGRLKVYAMTSFGQHYVVPSVARYQQHYPDVQIELTLAQQVPDLLYQSYDVALVLARNLPDSRLVSRRLGGAFSIACASPAYLKCNGVPHSLDDLSRHRCLQMVTPVSPTNEWTLDGPNSRETVALGPADFQVNVPEALAAAVREGMGIGLLPIYTTISGLRSGELVWILPEYKSQETNLYALYPSRQYLDAKIRTWVEFLRNELPAAIDRDQTELRQYSRTKFVSC